MPTSMLLRLSQMWKEISCLTSEGEIQKFAKSNKTAKLALKVLMGDSLGVKSSIIEACRIRRSVLQSDVIELLLLSDDCDTEEIESLTGVKLETIEEYASLFFRYRDVFFSKLDILDYIETGIKENTGMEDDSKLMSFLYKRWVMTLGKEFVIWRFQLRPIDYTPGLLFNSVFKEAYFYHKERSMGKEDISMADYTRSVKNVLDSIKSSLSIKDESKEDDVFDMQKELDIIIQDSDASDITISEIDTKDFINNT